MRAFIFSLLWTVCVAELLHAAPFDQLPAQPIPTPIAEPTPAQPTVRQPLPPIDLGVFPDEPEAAAEESPDDSLMAAAWSVYQQNDMAACLSKLRDLVAANPALPPPDLILVEFHLDAKRNAEARQLLETIAAEDDSHPQLFLSYGKLALSEGRLAEALLHFEKMEQLGPPRTWKEDQKLQFDAAVLSGKAAVAERRGNWGRAQEYLAEFVKLDPQNVSLRQRWAKALALAGNDRRALEQFDIAYRQDDHLSRPEVALAALHLSRGDVAKANRWFQTAIAAYPQDGAVHFAWSLALLMQNRPQEAQTEAKTAAKLGIDTPKLTTQLGVAAWALNELPAAKKQLTAATEKNPDNFEGRFQLIYLLSLSTDRQERDQALKLADEFAAAAPASALAQFAIGAARLGVGNAQGAYEILNGVVAQAQTRPDALLLWGRALSETGHESAARDVAKRLAEQLEEAHVFPARQAAKTWIDKTLGEKLSG